MVFWFFETTRWLFLIGSFISSVYYWKNYRNTAQKYFPVLLFVTILLELSATISVYKFGKESFIFYNIYSFVSISFFLYWLGSIQNRKMMLRLSISIFAVSIVASFFTGSIFDSLYGIPLVTGSVLILFSSFLFFKKLLYEEGVVNFLNNQQFWIVAGLLFFWIGFLPVYLLINSLSMKDPLIAMAIPFLNILLYGCFIIGFRCPNK